MLSGTWIFMQQVLVSIVFMFNSEISNLEDDEDFVTFLDRHSEYEIICIFIPLQNKLEDVFLRSHLL